MALRRVCWSRRFLKRPSHYCDSLRTKVSNYAPKWRIPETRKTTNPHRVAHLGLHIFSLLPWQKISIGFTLASKSFRDEPFLSLSRRLARLVYHNTHSLHSLCSVGWTVKQPARLGTKASQMKMNLSVDPSPLWEILVAQTQKTERYLKTGHVIVE